MVPASDAGGLLTATASKTTAQGTGDNIPRGDTASKGLPRSSVDVDVDVKPSIPTSPTPPAPSRAIISPFAVRPDSSHGSFTASAHGQGQGQGHGHTSTSEWCEPRAGPRADSSSFEIDILDVKPVVMMTGPQATTTASKTVQTPTIAAWPSPSPSLSPAPTEQSASHARALPATPATPASPSSSTRDSVPVVAHGKRKSANGKGGKVTGGSKAKAGKVPKATPTSASIPVASAVSSRTGATGATGATAMLSPHGFDPFTTPIDESYVYLYFRFCAERHRMYTKRCLGVPRDALTTDEVIRNTFVGNVFRELDPASERQRREIIERGDQSNDEICFRIFLFTAFYLEETWKALEKGLGEVPSWKTFNLERYEAVLRDYHVVRKNRIYYGGFQIVPPKSQFGTQMPSYSASLRMVKSMMDMALPAKLAECRYAADASEIIRTIPTFGGFLSLCLLVFLQDAPTLKFYYRNFATCGPGSRGYLRRIFGNIISHSNEAQQIALEQSALMWLYENQWRYWARIGEDPPHAWELGLRPGLRVLDIENALCWCHRYANDLATHKWSSLADLPLPPPPAPGSKEDEAQVPAWCDEERYADSVSKPAYVGDYAEEAAKLARLQMGKEGEDWYEVDKVVGRSGKVGMAKAGLMRVRWKGYPPEDDTWEREAALREDSAVALEEWYAWEATVRDTIAKTRLECAYKGVYEAGPVAVQAVRAAVRTVRPVKKARTARTSRLAATRVIEISDDEGPTGAGAPLEEETVVKAAERIVVRTTRLGVEIIPDPYTEDWRPAPPTALARADRGRAVKKEEVDVDI